MAVTAVILRYQVFEVRLSLRSMTYDNNIAAMWIRDAGRASNFWRKAGSTGICAHISHAYRVHYWGKSQGKMLQCVTLLACTTTNDSTTSNRLDELEDRVAGTANVDSRVTLNSGSTSQSVATTRTGIQHSTHRPPVDRFSLPFDFIPEAPDEVEDRLVHRHPRLNYYYSMLFASSLMKATTFPPTTITRAGTFSFLLTTSTSR